MDDLRTVDLLCCSQSGVEILDSGEMRVEIEINRQQAHYLMLTAIQAAQMFGINAAEQFLRCADEMAIDPAAVVRDVSHAALAMAAPELCHG